MGKTPRADVFAERHKQSVDLYPVLSREDSFERSNGFFRRRRLHIPPTVCHPMNVDINSDARLTTGNAKHQIGALRSDPTQGKQYLWITGQHAVILFHDAMSNLMDLRRLRLMKGTGLDTVIDGGNGKAIYLMGSARERK
jgi:hypothetical protein